MNTKLDQIETEAAQTFEAVKNEAFAKFEATVKAATEAARNEYINALQAAENAKAKAIFRARKEAVRNRKNTIDLSKVVSVYSGRAGACCCGCAGKHSYASAHRTWASTDRGYEVAADEISDHTVKTIVNKIEAALNNEVAAEKIETLKSTRGKYCSAVIGNRLYVAYFKA